MTTNFVDLVSKNPLQNILEFVKNNVVSQYENTENERVLKNPEAVEEFQARIQAILEKADANEVFDLVLSQKLSLFKDSKTAQNIITALCFLIASYQGGNPEQRTQAYLAFVKELPKEYSSTKIRMLASLYNVLNAKDQKQADLLMEIIQISSESKKFGILGNYIASIDSYFTQWKLSKDQERQILKAIIEAFDSLRTKEKINFTLKYLQSFEEDDSSIERHRDYTRSLVVGILNNEKIFLDDFLNYKAIKYFQEHEKNLYEILRLFMKGDIKGYQAWLQANPEYLGKIGISSVDFLKKLKIISISNLAENAPVIKYSVISSALEIPLEEVESWIILAIQNELITAKIDEYEETIYIIETSSKNFDNHEWEKLESTLGNVISTFEGYLENLKNKRI